MKWAGGYDGSPLGVGRYDSGMRFDFAERQQQRCGLTSLAGRHSIFAGIGLFCEDAAADDWVAACLPLGFRVKLQQYPIAFTFSTAARCFIDPDTSAEIFDEVRLGAFCEF